MTCATALDEGHIILVNLSGGGRVYERDADLLGRLSVRFLLFHSKRRHKPERPFFVYLDECHRYLSGDLENILAEARKFGVGLVLAHQWLAQLEREDENMLAAVRSATNLKAVFRLKDPEEAEDLAHMVVPLDLEMPVRALIKPTVVGHRLVRLKSESTGENTSTTASRSETEGESESETRSATTSVAETTTHGRSTTESTSTSIGEGTSETASRSRSFGEGTSSGESRSSSSGSGTSHAESSGAAHGTSSGQTMLPLVGDLFETPTVVITTEGTSSMSHSSHASGTNSSHAQATGSSTGRNSSRSETDGTARGTSTSKLRTAGTATGTSVTELVTESYSEGRPSRVVAIERPPPVPPTLQGTSRTQGTAEAFEPLYENLPSAVHSLENMKYMAAQTLRNLTAGKAFVNFVDASGMHPALLTVPAMQSFAPEPSAFEALRTHVLDRSPSATTIARATALITDREQRLLQAARKARESLEPREPQVPAEYRVKKSRPAPEPKSPSGISDQKRTYLAAKRR